MGERHHYVPRFYLNNFSIRRSAGFVYTYRRHKEPLRINISNVAVVKNLYRIVDRITGVVDNQLEDVYNIQIENPAAPILKGLISSQQLSLTTDERETLSLFVGHLSTRNPRFHEIHMGSTDYRLGKGREKYLKNLKEDEESVIDDIIEAQRLFFGEEMSRDEGRAKREEVLADLAGHLDVLDRDRDVLGRMAAIKWGNDLAEGLNEMNWYLLKSKGSRVFVGSDNPLSSTWDERNHLLCLPISPFRCLVFSHTRMGIEATAEVSREYVEYVNFRTMSVAHRFVFSNLLSKDIKTAFDKTRPVPPGEGVFPFVPPESDIS